MTAQEFTQQFPIGTPVDYTPIIGGTERKRTRIRSGAWPLGHGDVVVMVEGVIGGVTIEALSVVDEAQP
jgi:hypothetical protein